MRTTITAALVAATTLALPAAAEADRADCPRSLERAYSAKYERVAKVHGARAPGRDIRRYGVRFRGVTFDATCGELRRSLRQLRKLAKRQPYLAAEAVPPAQPPSGVQSVGYEPTGLASCIVQRESTNNHLAVNGQYSGIAQWSPEAWARHGGTRYAATPLGATRDQQLQVLAQGLAQYGCRDWCPFDGCG